MAEKQDNLIDRVSWVSRINIKEDERPMMQDVLAQAKELAGIASKNAGDEEPLYTVVPVSNRMRPGVKAERSELSQAGRLLANAPAVKGNYFKVAPILE